MAVKPTEKPRWADFDPGTHVVTPPSGRLDTGWLALDEPPAEEQNWLHYFTYLWINYFEELTDEINKQLPIAVRQVETLRSIARRQQRTILRIEQEQTADHFRAAVW